MAQQIVDPVCGMHIDPVLAPFEAVHQDKMYYFCSDRCCEIFQKDPDTYANEEFAGEIGQNAQGEELEQPTITTTF